MSGPVAVITGADIITGGAVGRTSYFEELLRESAAVIQQPVRGTVRVQRFIKEATVPPRLGDKKLGMHDKASRALLHAVDRALLDARLPSDHRRPCRSGVVVASTYTATSNWIEFDKAVLANGVRVVNPLLYANTMFSSQMMHTSIHHSLQGTNVNVSTGETAAIDGLQHAFHSLEFEETDLVVLAASEQIDQELHEYFKQIGYLLPEDTVDAASIPYDIRSKGAYLSECASAIIVERPRYARDRNANVLAEIWGVSTAIGDPSDALFTAIDRVFSEAGVAPAEVRFIVSAGNGYYPGDVIESRVLSSIFAPSSIPVSSPKGTMGESLSVSGLCQIIAAIHVGMTAKLFAIPGLSRPLDEMKLPLVMGEPASVARGYALVTTIGHLGGAAVALLKV